MATTPSQPRTSELDPPPAFDVVRSTPLVLARQPSPSPALRPELAAVSARALAALAYEPASPEPPLTRRLRVARMVEKRMATTPSQPRTSELDPPPAFDVVRSTPLVPARQPSPWPAPQFSSDLCAIEQMLHGQRKESVQLVQTLMQTEQPSPPQTP